MTSDPTIPTSRHRGCERSRCGRPPALGDAERKARILDSAAVVLQTHGYQASSMDRIAACSGMSKKTLYQMFTSKQGLFETLLTERLLETDLIDLALEGDTPLERLTFGLQHLADAFLSPNRIGLLRAVVTEFCRTPEIVAFMRGYFASSSRTFPLHVWLRDIGYAQIMTEAEIEDAAEHLFGMTVGLLALGDLVQFKPPKSTAQQKAFIERGAWIFTTAFPPPAPG